MELNREEIIKALECCGADDGCVGDKCPYYANCQFCITRISKDALALIKQQDEQIFKLENRLKECENGYEGTLYLDRCKLHDAEQKIKQDNMLIKQQSIFIEKLIKGVEEVKTNTVRRLQAELYEEFLKVARCQKENEPNMQSQEVFNILKLITKKALEEV